MKLTEETPNNPDAHSSLDVGADTGRDYTNRFSKRSARLNDAASNYSLANKPEAPKEGELPTGGSRRNSSICLLIGALAAPLFYAFQERVPVPRKSLDSIEGQLYVIGMALGAFAFILIGIYAKLRMTNAEVKYYILDRHGVVRTILEWIGSVLCVFVGWAWSVVLIVVFVMWSKS